MMCYNKVSAVWYLVRTPSIFYGGHWGRVKLYPQTALTYHITAILCMPTFAKIYDFSNSWKKSLIPLWFVSVKNELKQYSARSSRSHCPQTGYETSCPSYWKDLAFLHCVFSNEWMNRIMVKKSIEARSVHVVAGHKSQFDSGIQFQRHFVLIERLLYTHYIISLISLEFVNKSVPIIALLFSNSEACLMWQLNFSSKTEIPAFYNSNLNHRRRTVFSPLYLIHVSCTYCLLIVLERIWWPQI